MNRLIFFLTFVSVFPFFDTEACKLSPVSTWFWTPEELTEHTETVFVGKTLRSKAHSAVPYFRDYEFEVVEVLKGVINEKKIWLQRFAPESFIAPSTQEKGRAAYAKDCKILTSFRPGNFYLIFLNAFHPKGYEQLANREYQSSPWYADVKKWVQPNKPLVTNPYDWVGANEGGSLRGLTRFFLDLNDDGVPELFLASTGLIGKMGGPFHVFQQRNSAYQELGIIFTSIDTLETPPSKTTGFSDLRVCLGSKEKSCRLIDYAFNSKEYRKRTDQVLKKPYTPKYLIKIKSEHSDDGKIWQ
jgi:hypothetical protein